MIVANLISLDDLRDNTLMIGVGTSFRAASEEDLEAMENQIAFAFSLYKKPLGRRHLECYCNDGNIIGDISNIEEIILADETIYDDEGVADFSMEMLNFFRNTSLKHKLIIIKIGTEEYPTSQDGIDSVIDIIDHVTDLLKLDPKKYDYRVIVSHHAIFPSFVKKEPFPESGLNNMLLY